MSLRFEPACRRRHIGSAPTRLAFGRSPTRLAPGERHSSSSKPSRGICHMSCTQTTVYCHGLMSTLNVYCHVEASTTRHAPGKRHCSTLAQGMGQPTTLHMNPEPSTTNPHFGSAPTRRAPGERHRSTIAQGMGQTPSTQRESSLLTTYWSESTQSSRRFSAPASLGKRHSSTLAQGMGQTPPSSSSSLLSLQVLEGP